MQDPGARRRPLGPGPTLPDPARRGRPLPPGGAGLPQQMSGGGRATPMAQPSDAQRAGGSRLRRARAAPVGGGEEPLPSVPASDAPAAPASFSSQNPAPLGLSAARLVSAFSTARSPAGEGRLRGAPPPALPGDPAAGSRRLGRFPSPRGPGPPPRPALLAPRCARCRCPGSPPSFPEPREPRGSLRRQAGVPAAPRPRPLPQVLDV